MEDVRKKPRLNVYQIEKRNAFLFLWPYVLLFTVFIIVPIIMAILLSLTQFDSVNFPKFVLFKNYIYLFTRDKIFMQQVLPNTIKFALIVGPVGYILSFFLAWCLAQIPHRPRTVLAIILYTPSMTMGIAMAVLWRVIFSGNEAGYLNNLLLNLGLIKEPIQWLQSPYYILGIMIFVSLWGSLGVGFLGMLSGVLNINSELYEAAYIDGLKNRFQEIIYITIPMMKPQMLFGAVMSVVSTFSAGAIGVQLTGSNPTPQYAGQLIYNHIEDFGFIQYEMGYAAAVSVILLLLVMLVSKISYRLFGTRD
jgi:multiple sugar transport system permease protein